MARFHHADWLGSDLCRQSLLRPAGRLCHETTAACRSALRLSLACRGIAPPPARFCPEQRPPPNPINLPAPCPVRLNFSQPLSKIRRPPACQAQSPPPAPPRRPPKARRMLKALPLPKACRPSKIPPRFNGITPVKTLRPAKTQRLTTPGPPANLLPLPNPRQDSTPARCPTPANSPTLPKGSTPAITQFRLNVQASRQSPSFGECPPCSSRPSWDSPVRRRRDHSLPGLMDLPLHSGGQFAQGEWFW